ncbi:MAG: trypsin-like peptidase domain-containing protein [Alphaproteobacteria bacterium]|nr:trypsin-like peptidase domain-containing protein [Alphaproteobacteria bacterium]
MKRLFKKIIGYLIFFALLILCLTFYVSYIKHEPALTAIKEDAKKLLSFHKQTNTLEETEESKAIDRAIAIDSGLIDAKPPSDKVEPNKIEPEKKINTEEKSSSSPPPVADNPNPTADSPKKELTRKNLLDQVRKGVVIIKVKSYTSTQNNFNQNAWSGTGFIVNLEKGLIATNHHVTGDMAVCTYEVKFSDGTTTTAKLNFFDPLLDFAFLTIDPKDFPTSSIALELSKNPVKVNDTIYSMGNSAGDEFSTYKGTVFGIYESLGSFSEQSFRFSGLTVGGASGSPVFDEDGKVVGIIYGGKFVSGAALPISYVVRALQSLNKGEQPNRQSLGLVLRYDDLKDAVNVGVLPAETQTEYNKAFPAAHNKILVIDTRLVESPASAQFMAGDIIWKVQGQLIGPELAKFDEIVDSSLGKAVSVEVYRDGKLVLVEAKPYPLTNDGAEKFIQFSGATWFDYNEKIRLMTGDKGPGVFISSADVTSPFKGLFKESLFGNSRPIKVTHINGKAIQNLADLEKLIPELLPKKMFSIKFIDFLGQQSFGQTVSADRQERFVILKYDSKFDNPKVFAFNKKTLEWDIKELKGGVK